MSAGWCGTFRRNLARYPHVDTPPLGRREESYHLQAREKKRDVSGVRARERARERERERERAKVFVSVWERETARERASERERRDIVERLGARKKAMLGQKERAGERERERERGRERKSSSSVRSILTLASHQLAPGIVSGCD